MIVYLCNNIEKKYIRDMRTIIVNGRVVNDAQLKTGKNGAEYLTFRFANNEFGEKDANGNPLTVWYTVNINTPRLFRLKDYIVKGKPLNIIGHYMDRLYLNEKAGTYEIGRTIIAESIDFEIGKPMTATNQQQVSGQQTTQYQPTPNYNPQANTKAVQQPVANVGATVGTYNPGTDLGDDDLPF